MHPEEVSPIIVFNSIFMQVPFDIAITTDRLVCSEFEYADWEEKL